MIEDLGYQFLGEAEIAREALLEICNNDELSFPRDIPGYYR